MSNQEHLKSTNSFPGQIKLHKIVRIPGTDKTQVFPAHMSSVAIDRVEVNPVTQKTKIIFCYGGTAFDVQESVDEVKAMISASQES
jgi:hypothetical protein